jgi:hypothetical protein
VLFPEASSGPQWEAKVDVAIFMGNLWMGTAGNVAILQPFYLTPSCRRYEGMKVKG